MGTRGLFGFRYKGRHYLIWNQFDSYRSALGMAIINDIKEAIKNGDKTLEKWKQLLLKIKVVSEDSKPTEEDKKALAKIFPNEKETELDSWELLEKKTYQSPALILESGYLIECCENSYDVEYSYLINLDDHCLEFFEYNVPFQWKEKEWNSCGDSYNFDDLPNWEGLDNHCDETDGGNDDDNDDDKDGTCIDKKDIIVCPSPEVLIKYDTTKLDKKYLVVSNNDQTIEWVEPAKDAKSDTLSPCWFQVPTLSRLQNGKFLVTFKIENMADRQIGIGFLVERHNRDGSNRHFDWGFFGYLGSSATGFSYDPSTGDIVTNTRSICGGLPKITDNKGQITLGLDLTSEPSRATFYVNETACPDILLPKGVVIMPAVCLLSAGQKVTINGPLTLLGDHL